MIYNTIAILKAAPIPSDNYATVLGYNLIGDGGGDDFYWDASDTTSVDNGGTIFISSVNANGRWKRLFSGPINVRWFGPKGDGATDDTAQLQNAFNVCANLVSSLELKGDFKFSEVNFPKGLNIFGQFTMRSDTVSTCLRFLRTSFNSPIKIVEEGISQIPAGSIQITVVNTKTILAGDTLFITYKGPLDDPNIITISNDMSAVGYQRQVVTVQSVSENTDDGIYILTLDNRTLWDLDTTCSVDRIDYDPTGVRIRGGTFILNSTETYAVYTAAGVHNVAFTDCTFTSKVSKTAMGLRFQGAFDVNFRNCKFISLNTVCLNFVYGSISCNVYESYFNYNKVADSFIVYYIGCNNSTISGNKFYGDSIDSDSGVTMHAKTYNILITNNSFYGMLQGVLLYFGAFHNLIDGNSFIGQARSGITVSAANYNTISNNIFTKIGDKDSSNYGTIILVNALGTTVKNNQIWTDDGRAITAYYVNSGGHFTADTSTQRRDRNNDLSIIGNKIYNGYIELNIPGNNRIISDNYILNGRITNYTSTDQAYGFYNKINNNYIKNGGIVTRLMQEGEISGNEIDANGKDYGIQVLQTYLCNYTNNRISNASLFGITLATTNPYNQYVNNIESNTFFNCGGVDVVENGNTESSVPIHGSISVPLNFFTAVANWNRTKQRVLRGWRYNGGVGSAGWTKEFEALLQQGTATNRPTATVPGFQYFDTTLGEPIWWNGSNWVDSTGVVV